MRLPLVPLFGVFTLACGGWMAACSSFAADPVEDPATPDGASPSPDSAVSADHEAPDAAVDAAGHFCDDAGDVFKCDDFDESTLVAPFYRNIDDPSLIAVTDADFATPPNSVSTKTTNGDSGSSQSVLSLDNIPFATARQFQIDLHVPPQTTSGGVLVQIEARSPSAADDAGNKVGIVSAVYVIVGSDRKLDLRTYRPTGQILDGPSPLFEAVDAWVRIVIDVTPGTASSTVAVVQASARLLSGSPSSAETTTALHLDVGPATTLAFRVGAWDTSSAPGDTLRASFDDIVIR